MKLFNYKSILATVFLSLVGAVQLMADKGNPIPAPKGAGGFDTGSVVGGPIDNYLPLLFFMALVFGIWMINSSKKVSAI